MRQEADGKDLRTVIKPHLVLMTDGWPYGKREKPFIGPELEFLRKRFDVTVVSTAQDSVAAVEEDVSPVPGGVRLLRLPPVSKLCALAGAASMLLDRAGRAELRASLTGGQWLKRLYYGVRYWAQARHVAKFLEGEGLTEWADVFYGYWLNYYALAFVMERKRLEKEDKIPACSLASGYGRPYLCARAHGYDLYNERYPGERQPFHEELGKWLDEVVFVSNKGREYFEEHFVAPERSGAKLVTSYLGAHPRVSAPELVPRDPCIPFTIVSCSNVIPLKRVGLIAQGIAASSIKNYRWVHFGDGPAMDDVRALVQELGVSCEFKGHCANEQVLEWLSRGEADVFVTTSSSEGLPVSVQEAMYFGLPVVATDVGGMVELLDGNGILLPANPNAEQVGEALSRIDEARSEGAWSDMARRSRELWAQRFDSDINGECFSRELERAVRQ